MRTLTFVSIMCAVSGSAAADNAISFEDEIAPLLEQRCLGCHGAEDPRGGLSLNHRAAALQGGESGPVFVPFRSKQSLLFDYIEGDQPEMPKDAAALTSAEVTLLRKWIDAGAPWPADRKLSGRRITDRNWWSLQPLASEALPPSPPTGLARSPIDHFILHQLAQRGLHFSAAADRRTQLRRVSFDLLGLPPSPAEMEAFLTDVSPDAYERRVDQLLASPHYGERWARHWLDVVHYGDTHGYDKDKLRPNAWPYRDYVIRSFNRDKPYRRFVREQLAGDAFWPGTVDGIEATGFLAAGPWDFIGHVEVPETKIDGMVARHLDRDDIVRTVLETFCSTTVGCAQCHHHKFDPITMQDYYNLQAVFASIDRAEREYDRDPTVAAQRSAWTAKLRRAKQKRETLAGQIGKFTGPEVQKIEQEISRLETAAGAGAEPKPEFGYHSKIEKQPDAIKWVQVDLGASVSMQRITIVGCHDSFNDIGAGFGFPRRFRIEVSDQPDFKSTVTTVVDRTAIDVDNPGVTPQSFSLARTSARYIRVTATKLMNRLPTDYNFALAEIMVFDGDPVNLALGKRVTSLDSVEAPTRWRRSNLTDGYYYGVWNHVDLKTLAQLTKKRDTLLKKLVPAALRGALATAQRDVAEAETQLKTLPPKSRVYAGCVHAGSGNFVGRAGKGPRTIHVLHRGQVTAPRAAAFPATIDIIDGFPSRFPLSTNDDESARRMALADWIVRADNPLTWRSIVNRLWQYHFGRALVDSPSDFGRMGQAPTHPALLNWLASRFRDEGQSMKRFHRLIVTSHTYRQRSLAHHAGASLDAGNRFLWRMNRRKLDAEALRDTTLFIAGRLDRRMGGPGFRDFVLERPQHSPHYEYHKHDPLDPVTHRRSIYRFLVRSQPQPFMEVLDCADPSQMVDKRNETVTALQSLAMLNNAFVVAMSEQFAARLKDEQDDLPLQVDRAFRLTLNRAPTDNERRAVASYAEQHGLANTCRVLLNMNEFAFVD